MGDVDDDMFELWGGSLKAETRSPTIQAIWESAYEEGKRQGLSSNESAAAMAPLLESAAEEDVYRLLLGWLDAPGPQAARNRPPVDVFRSLREQLLRFHELDRKLESVGGPEKDGALFERVIGASSDILDWFGLPESKDFERALWSFREGAPSPERVTETIRRLLHHAIEHAALARLPRDERLLQLLAADAEPGIVLPKLGFTHTRYGEFLLLLAKREPDRVDEILRELEATEPVREEVHRYLVGRGRDAVARAALEARGLVLLGECLESLKARR